MPFHIRKVLDFGTTEPWVARLWLGIFQFRDFVYTGTKRLAFDQKYAPVLNNLYECYKAMILLHKTIAEHETKVSSQEIFHVQNGNFMVTENIDTQMSHRRTCEDNDLVGEVTREAKDRIKTQARQRQDFDV